MTKDPRPHPDHEWLLLMSDGELPAEARAAVQKHLEACWECRHELQQIEGAIGDAVRYRKEVLGRHLPLPPEPWRDLSAGFAAIDRELAPPGLLSRFAAALRMPRYAIPLAAAALGATVLVVRNSAPATSSVPRSQVATAEVAFTSSPRVEQPKPAIGSTPIVEPGIQTLAQQPASPEELAHSAVRVAGLLRERVADLGEPIEFGRADGRVMVRAYGLDAERFAELQALLRQIPFVEFRNSDEAPPSSMNVAQVSASTGKSPFREELERALGGEAAVEEWSNDSLDQAEAIMARAHALRRLADEFSADALNADDARVLRALRREHAQAMVAGVARLERTLAVALRSLGASAAPLPTAAASETNLITAARRLESSVGELAGAKAVGGSADPLPGRLATDLAAAGALARAFAARY